MNDLEHYLPEKIMLVDTNLDVIAALQKEFLWNDRVVVAAGDYFSVPTNAIVSPTNSFGVMDAGLDKLIVEELGRGVQKTVTYTINRYHQGYLPVGTAEHSLSYSLTSGRYVNVISAPTVSMSGDDVSKTINAFLAFRAALLCVCKANRLVVQHNLASEMKILTMTCCGLCTGIGLMSPERAARQMRIALEQVCMSKNELDTQSIHDMRQFYNHLIRE